MATALETLTTGGRIVISFPESAMPPAEKESFISFLKSEWTVRQSQFRETDARELSSETDSSWWRDNREKILRRIGEA